MNYNDGPAFPVPFPPAGQKVTDEILNRWVKKMGGMTLRDYFAASVLKGIFSKPHEKDDVQAFNSLGEGKSSLGIARMCYAQA